ncbi:MAG: hypothetical protein ABSG16_12235 [Candidatus Acidiferrum sp.]
MPFPSRRERDFVWRFTTKPRDCDLHFEPTFDGALREILEACREACEARRNAPEGTPEWHKRTGEILAYAKMTNVFSQLQDTMLEQEH